MFDAAKYAALFVQRQGDFTDCAKYSVSVNVLAGTMYRCIGVHHLTPDENMGNHNIYVDVLDESGKRVKNAVVNWNWVGQKASEQSPPVVLDKPASEPGGNIALGAGQIVTVWVSGGTSDVIANLRTDHPDEGAGNTRYHHSFYVVWQRGKAPGPPQPPTPEPETPPIPMPTTPREVCQDVIDRLRIVAQNVSDCADDLAAQVIPNLK
jgi:hypothetical protein